MNQSHTHFPRRSDRCSGPTAIAAVILLIITGSLHAQQAQDSSQYIWRIETNDGNRYSGTIEQVEEGVIQCQTDNIGTITLRVRDIKSMKVLDPERLKKTGYISENPLANAYIFWGSGYPVGRKKAYYRNTWIFIQQFEYGVSDYFSLGGGFLPGFLLFGGPVPAWVNPKVSIPVKDQKMYLGVNSLFGAVIGGFGESPIGIFTGTATIGSPDKQFSFGAGYATNFESGSGGPVIQVGGLGRLARNTYFMTENYLLDGGANALVSLGGRTIWRKIALDYGGFIPLGDVGGFLLTPWLSVTLPLGGSFDTQ